VVVPSSFGRKGFPGEDMANAPTFIKNDSRFVIVAFNDVFLGGLTSLGDSSSPPGDYACTLWNIKLGSFVVCD
jgi:hypothetical protein